MRANCLPRLKILWYKLLEFENVFEKFVKKILSQMPKVRNSGNYLILFEKMNPKTMSDQVYILISDVPIYEPVV